MTCAIAADVDNDWLVIKKEANGAVLSMSKSRVRREPISPSWWSVWLKQQGKDVAYIDGKPYTSLIRNYTVDCASDSLIAGTGAYYMGTTVVRTIDREYVPVKALPYSIGESLLDIVCPGRAR